jgi:hypothetical protein
MKLLHGLRVLVVLVASVGAGARAEPLVFTTAKYDTTAFAFSGALADADSDASPTSPLPLISTATVLGANDFATAFAIASSGLLSASAESDSFPGAFGATAGAQSHFVGTFTGTDPLSLNLDFDNLSALVGGGTSAATLFVLLTSATGSTTTTLLNSFYTVGGDISLYFPALGDLNTLDLLLFSEAATTGAGQSGQNISQLVFTGTIGATAVPEPGTIALASLALLFLGATRRRRDGQTY